VPIGGRLASAGAVPSRVLLIDDDFDMCELLGEQLAPRGFEVTSRGSADEGLHLLTEQDFDVVITDVSMSTMTGVDLCRRIVANREDLPVIVMTASGSLETSVQGAVGSGAGAVVYRLPLSVSAVSSFVPV
jgi:DNA-binding NtrC family response regulator